MKKILITGAGSYIGTSVKKWLSQFPDKYQTDELDMKDSSWKAWDFSIYDVVFHVAGLAHVDVGKVSEERKKDYYRVNCNLAIETAKKAKAEGVKHFIFMSSMIVYGGSGRIGEKKVITPKTVPVPQNFYGDSKLQAENGILSLADDVFNVTVLRPPMIYGNGSKGNYNLLSKLAHLLPVFPDIRNERSMLYIDNLCEYVRLTVDTGQEGILFPQNKEYGRTTDIVKMIAAVHGKKIWTTQLFNWLIVLIGKTSGKNGQMVNKAFGNLVYEKDMSRCFIRGIDYHVASLEESVKLSENSLK